MRYLRKKTDGYIYVWTPQLAARADMEPYEAGPTHHVLMPANKFVVVARGALTVEEPTDSKMLSTDKAQQIAKTLYRPRGRKAA